MRSNWVNLLFAVTIFLGAFLLFQVQPLIGKYILPWFGGSYGVWTTCLLFFQVMLLAGYLYAHGTAQYLSARGQMIVHLVLLAAAVAMLPITPSESWIPNQSANPAPRILALLFASVGIPYLALASTGPLLQAWFARVRPGQSPYRLYALSNVASMLALLSYPFIVEPNMTRTAQARMWGYSLVAFTICCAALSILVVRPPVPAVEKIAEVPPSRPPQQSSRKGKQKRQQREARSPQVSPPLRVEHLGLAVINRKIVAAWILLPTLASATLLSVTNKICQDVAAVPLLWILPLTLYLLTFIICFDSPRWYVRKVFVGLMAVSVVLATYVMSPFHIPMGILIETAVYGAVLFCSCMVYHGELVRLRPVAEHLTLYYAMIAAGGALGGFLVAIVAPLAFKDFYELNLCLLAALALALFLVSTGGEKQSWSRRLFIGGLGLLVILALALAQFINQATTLDRTRNFYGVLLVLDIDTGSEEVAARKLLHGQITHGFQFIKPDENRRLPISYYGPQSGIGVALRNMPRAEGKGLKVGVIGLGAGSLAAYARKGDVYKYYEINPEVERFARTYFTYIADAAAAGAAVDVVLGDARMSLQRATEPENFDLIALDAFNGDAVPVHLLTKECFEVYLRHLRRPGGVIAIHITNHYLDLSPIATRAAEYFKMSMADIVNGEDRRLLIAPARWILITDDAAFLNIDAIREAKGRSRVDYSSVRMWTDNDTSLFPILRTNLPSF